MGGAQLVYVRGYVTNSSIYYIFHSMYLQLEQGKGSVLLLSIEYASDHGQTEMETIVGLYYNHDI